MLKRKDKVVKSNNDGIVYLFKKNKITLLPWARELRRIPVRKSTVNGETLQAKNVIIATGSNPGALPGAEFDEKLILSNTGALAIPDVPKRLGVIGAGVIGLEMGSVWRRLGSEGHGPGSAARPSSAWPTRRSRRRRRRSSPSRASRSSWG